MAVDHLVRPYRIGNALDPDFSLFLTGNDIPDQHIGLIGDEDFIGPCM